MVLPLQPEPHLVATLIRERVFERLNHRRRLAHAHLDAAEIPRWVVGQPPLSGLLVDDELPVVGVRQIDIERVVALRHGKTAHVEIGIGVEARRRVCARAPHGIVAILADSSVLAEELAFAALHRRRGVVDADRPGGDRDHRGLAGAFLRRSETCGGEKHPGECHKRFHVAFLLRAGCFSRTSWNRHSCPASF